jgi:hypothetical protein
MSHSLYADDHSTQLAEIERLRAAHDTVTAELHSTIKLSGAGPLLSSIDFIFVLLRASSPCELSASVHSLL